MEDLFIDCELHERIDRRNRTHIGIARHISWSSKMIEIVNNEGGAKAGLSQRLRALGRYLDGRLLLEETV